MRKSSRGGARMAEYETKLANEIEARVLRENKIAKTGSATDSSAEKDFSATTYPPPPTAADHRPPASDQLPSAGTGSSSSTGTNNISRSSLHVHGPTISQPSSSASNSTFCYFKSKSTFFYMM